MTNAASHSAPTSDGHFGHLRQGRSLAAIKGVFWSTLNTVVPAIMTALVFLVSSRLLTPYDFGVVALATSMVSLAIALAPAAFAEALVQRSQIEDRHTDTIFWMCFGTAILLFVPYFIFAGVLADWVDEPLLRWLLPFLGLKILFDLAAAVPTMLLVRVMKFRLVALRTAVASIGGAAVCLTLLMLDFGPWALAAAQITTSFIAMVVAFLSAGWRPGRQISWSALRDLFRYGAFTTGERFLNLFNLDQMLIGLLTSPAVLGIFNFAYRLLTILNNLIAGALSSVSHSVLSSMQSEPEKMRRTFMISSYASSVVAFPLFAGLAVTAQTAVPLLFGAHWAPAIVPVQAISMIGVMASISIPQAALLKSQGKAQWWFGYQLVQKVFTVLVILLFYSQGLSILLLAMVIKTILIWPVSVVMTARILQTGVWAYLISYIPPVTATVGMAIAVIFIPQYLDITTPWALLGLQVAIGVGVYAGLIGLMSINQLRQMFRILQNARATT
ncbi:lipopolysaccharide biosynthesis protein [Parasulfitobacter algicola]|uniref:Lipopolysaccharide biosynthesis protein n=1 Tax=Parasulfitobacter algicola TaxID=2614809 RepID=A0ABX2IPW6_9RHOB|nr:lipopolysaccharide biosynthesis protein [Sulfitobacter algicola]NSX54903.1 lipopolysaccharide biosynthesis protein [Sulfitobacter algicola]